MDFSAVTGDSFYVGDNDIDDFFLHDAERHFQDGMAVTYQLRHKTGQQILALVSLQNDAIRLCEEDRKNLGYPYRSTPAVKIGRLGVQHDLQGTGTGTILLDMVRNFMRTANRTGCRFITLDAYNKHSVLHFYEKNGFAILKNPKQSQETVPMYADLWE